MKKIEKIILAAICGALLLTIIGTWYLNGQKSGGSEQPSQQEEQLNYIIEGNLTIPPYEFLGNQNQYVVSGEYAMVANSYILNFESKQLQDSEDFSFSKEGETLKFVYQKFDAADSPVVVSLSDLANSFKEGYVLSPTYFTINYDERDYLLVLLRSKEANAQQQYHFLPVVFNFETGELEEFSNLKDASEEIYSEGMYGMYLTSLSTPVTDTTFSLVSNIHVNSQVVLESTVVNTMNVHLLEEHPFLKEELSNDQILVIRPRPNMVTPEEWFNQTLHWFSPVDGDPLTVHLIYENDGDKSYPIRSYADYLKATEDKTE